MRLWHWLRRRNEIDDDLQAEIRSHLAMATRDQIEDGQDPDTARLRAQKEFGNVLRTTEDTRRIWRGDAVEWLVDIYQDIRFGIRQLTTNRAFSLVVIVVLTLGIGGNAAVFSLFKSVALKPLPGVRHSASLAVVANRTRAGNLIGVSYPDFRYLRDHHRGFKGLTGSAMQPFILGVGRTGERVWGELVTGEYFELLGVGAQLGRTLLPSDEVAAGQHPVVVISDGLWRRSFGADPTIVGKTIQINRYPMTVVGVAAAEFQGTIVSLVNDLFIPIMMQPQFNPVNRLENRAAEMLAVFGRLKANTTLAEASAQTGVLGAQIEADRPVANSHVRPEAIPIWQSPFGAQTYLMPALMLIGTMGVLVLLVACANVANLVMVRGVARRGEIAVRAALGASRRRILRLLFVENLVLALPGAVCGVALSTIVLPMISSGASASAPMRIHLDTSADWMVLGFAVALSCASALVFGFVPALQIARVDLATAMKNDATPRTGTRARLRGALVVAQVAVSLILLVAAALVWRGLESARQVDAGFDPRAVAAVSLDLEPSGYTRATGPGFYDALLRTLREDPALESASLASVLPLTLVDGPSRFFIVEGYQPRADEEPSFLFNIVAADYFKTLRIPVLAGREFDERDAAAATAVAVINETMARRFWDTPQHAIGKRIATAPGEWKTVVGVVRDLKYARLTEGPRPYVYLAQSQAYQSSFVVHARARTTGADARVRVETHIRVIDPDMPILDSRMLIDHTRVALSNYQIAASTLAMFGTMTIALAALGIYGLVAYAVRQSTQEIGIRLAIGASRADVARRFLSRGLGLAAIGAALGLTAAIAITRILANIMTAVGPVDAVSFVAATSLVMAIAVCASIVPAWRASRLDPLTALRRH